MLQISLCFGHDLKPVINGQLRTAVAQHALAHGQSSTYSRKQSIQKLSRLQE
ncbi:hypothetical protein M378DRAFT_165677 [Amanita muscaria Koide BX008]|uniref:Uncharacterized protein n=1 Tax=Amanita muscaria (strain Koide BX008) TaxID=946122 RepID=A0A0C2T7A6_AMAMK|nr:hypothetical protein M378DRAFT_165677 [Amanita muscaria Koide BX008]